MKMIEEQGLYIYRGHRKKSWVLIPSIGRDKYGQPRKDEPIKLEGFTVFPRIREREDILIENFRLELSSTGVNLDKTYPKLGWNENDHGNDIAGMVYGRHYGLPTSLLDFSNNPLVALYFAVEGDSEEDSVVWCFPKHGIIRNITQNQVQELKAHREQNDKMPIIIYPEHISERIRAQSSIFVYFPGQIIPFNEIVDLAKFINNSRQEIFKITIPKRNRAKILSMLDMIGINSSTLFPGADGIGKYWKWKFGKM